ncbi:pentatricopeptide repeat-containing protein At3g63370, chloroplastic [Mangifera indica]|uniref:pentatricopeptide repeat-containing protein At3g63370, chloroplastic n=1 Tax=Mangifera indica TaxID=29780 RepID=UPI001CFA7BFB|nr:pentatricopeptide repeat-containing protein At3g63370, chloroplastic [Mangifera indica]
MRLNYYPAHYLLFSCKYSLMATSFPNCCINASTSSHQPLLNGTHANPPPNIPNIFLNSIKSPSLKQICSQGNLKAAFQSLSYLFTDSNSLVISPDEAYAQVLELCASRKALLHGRQIHGRLIKSYNGICESLFLGTKLVFMYGKCGCIIDAEKVFDKMSERTIFTWNALLGAYVSYGEPLRALKTYREMRVLGIPLDACTFPCVLKACSVLRDLNCGAEIHGLIIKCGYDSVVFVVNSLVAMYAKCRELVKAKQLFDRVGEKNDVVLWNSIISAYSASGHNIEALDVFRSMPKAGLVTNSYTFVAALQACEDSLFKKLGMEIHTAILKSSQKLEVYVGNALIAMYARCGKLTKAERVFNSLEDKDEVSWNSMLSGFVQNGMYAEAMQFFHDLQRAGHQPDQVSVISALTASGRLGNLLNGMELHAYAIKRGAAADLQVGNTLLDMYAKCFRPRYMDSVFDQMHVKDFISWTTIIAGNALNNCHGRALALFRKVQTEGVEVDTLMIGSALTTCIGLKCMSKVKEIHGYIIRKGLSDLVLQNSIVDVYGECGNIIYARKMFQSIQSKDIVSWTSMMSTYDHNGLANEALEIFYLMNESETNVEPDSIAIVCILSAAASLSASKKGKQIHGFIIRKGFSLEGSLGSSLVDMYARCGDLEKAYKVFDSLRNKGVVLWTSMINANGLHGHGKAAIDLFYKMESENIAPDHITFLALLYACSHSGLINEGKTIIDLMRCEYRLEPWPEHYACIVDLLGRANRLEEAYLFVKSMQTEPHAEIWSALLRACQIHSNKELGEIAARKLLELDPGNPGNYVLVSNVFAASGRWKDVEEVRMRMKESGLKKTPGCSWMEIGNRLHTFIARDKSHPESNEIYQKLTQITKILENEAGYVAQTKFVFHNVEEEEKVQMLYGHSERLAIAYGLLKSTKGATIRITKNLRVCGDCHVFCKLVSRFFERELVVRDANRFHHFKDGICSCGDFW